MGPPSARGGMNPSQEVGYLHQVNTSTRPLSCIGPDTKYAYPLSFFLFQLNASLPPVPTGGFGEIRPLTLSYHYGRRFPNNNQGARHMAFKAHGRSNETSWHSLNSLVTGKTLKWLNRFVYQTTYLSSMTRF